MIKQGRIDLSDEDLDKLIGVFASFKAEEDRIENDVIFVRTRAFNDLSTRQGTRANTVLLGRKGDGKTALLKRLAHDLRLNGKEPNGFRTVEVFEQIDMEDTYFTELINQFRQITGSIRALHPEIPEDLIARKLWIKFLALTSLRIACRTCIDLANTETLEADRTELESIERAVLQELDSAGTHVTTATVSQGFLPFLKRLLRKISISDKALAEELSDDERREADPMRMIQDVPQEFENAALVIGRARVHVTLALDRFDDFVDRLVSNDLSVTRQLRRQFLHGLVSAVSQLQRMKSFSWLRVIASLPDDLVIDIDFREMASVQSRLFVRIQWSLQDLRNMLDNRISSVLPNSRWQDLFPFQVSSSNKRVQKREASNDYLIRHTTRRPRELMTHAHEIFTKLRDTRRSIESKTMNLVVAASNPIIVDKQVVPEWKSVLPSLPSVIQRLHRSGLRTVFTFGELAQTKIASLVVPETKHEGKALSEEIKALLTLSLLFRVGMVGFRLRRATPGVGYIRQGESDHVRYFYSYSPAQDGLKDVTALLTDPKLRDNVDLEQGKAVRAMLVDGKQAKYEIQLCFAPLFFESLDAEHDFSFVVDEIVEEDAEA